MDLWVGFANICKTQNAAHTRADVATMLRKATGHDAWLLGFCEVEKNTWHHAAVAQAAAENTAQVYWPDGAAGAANAVPLLCSPGIPILARGSELALDGNAGVTPNRYCNWFVVDLGGGVTPWMIATQYLSSAWTRHPDRRPQWEAHNHVLHRLVRRLLDSYGPHGLIVGDFNRNKYTDPALTTLGATYHWAPQGTHGKRWWYDDLISFGGTGGRATRIPLFSDHDGVAGTIGFTPITTPVPTPKPASPPKKESPVKLPQLKAPSPPYVPARWHGGTQNPQAVVMHGTVSQCAPGGARGVANFFAHEADKTSAHYTVDCGPSDPVIQCVYDNTVAYHCGYNQDTLSIELCDPERGSARRWTGKSHQRMLASAAELVAQLCLVYGIEMRRPSIAELKRQGPHGIYGHNDSRLAFGYTTHVDPTGFPWAAFLDRVAVEATRLAQTTGATPPTAAKKPAKKPAAKTTATRGSYVDHAMADLKAASGQGRRAQRINNALETLSNIGSWRTPRRGHT